LEDLLIPQLSTLLSEENTIDSDLASTIELALAEISDGIMSESDLRGLLMNTLWSIEQSLSMPPRQKQEFNITTSSNASNMESEKNLFAVTSVSAG